MSYKERFDENNVDLQSILDTVNALPEVGSGGESTAELCTLTIKCGEIVECWYTTLDGANLKPVQVEISDIFNYLDVLKNSTVMLFRNGSGASIDTVGDGYELVGEKEYYPIAHEDANLKIVSYVWVKGDAFVDITSSMSEQ